jgi:hypothetical protein
VGASLLGVWYRQRRPGACAQVSGNDADSLACWFPGGSREIRPHSMNAAGGAGD